MTRLKIFMKRKVFTTLQIPDPLANMDASSLLAESVATIIKEVVKGPIVFEGKIAPERLLKHR